MPFASFLLFEPLKLPEGLAAAAVEEFDNYIAMLGGVVDQHMFFRLVVRAKLA